MAGAGGPRDLDSHYVQDCRLVQTNTHAIQTLTGQISRQVGQLHSDKDFLQCRRMVDDAVRQTTETRATLTRFREYQQQAQNLGERNNRKMMYQKLSDNLVITARVLEDVVRRFQQEEQRRRRPYGGGDAAAGEEQIALVETGAAVKMKTLRNGPTALDEELEGETYQAVRRVDEDVRCLQRIYSDLAKTTVEQQATFESLESHIAAAAIDIERGRDELQYTHKHAWGQRLKRKMVACGMGGMVVVGLLAYLTSG